MKKHLKNIAERGSMMVEALAMLGLITMVTPVIYKKAAERTTELQDINTATQLRTVSKALDDYIKDHYSELSEEEGEFQDIEADKVKAYLPYNFETKSKMFGDFQFKVRKSDIKDADNNIVRSSFTGVVLAPLADENSLPKIRASKIASMIGANGGIYGCPPDNPGCGDDDKQFNGVQGSWAASPDKFGFENVKTNSLAVSSVHAVTSSGAVNDDNVLMRVSDGDQDHNTMETTLYMRGHGIRGNNFTLEGDGNIWAGGNIDADGDLRADGDIEAGGDLSADSGTFSGDLKVVNGGGDVFSVDNSGNLKAAGGTFSGLLEAGSAEITGALSALSGTFSGELKVENSSGEVFKVDNSGNLTADGGTFNGDLSAASGTFSGNLKVVNGDSEELFSVDVNSGKLTAADGVFGNLEATTGTIGALTTDDITFNNELTNKDSSFNVDQDGKLKAKDLVATNSLNVGENEVFYVDTNNMKVQYSNAKLNVSSDGVLATDGVEGSKSNMSLKNDAAELSATNSVKVSSGSGSVEVSSDSGSVKVSSGSNSINLTSDGIETSWGSGEIKLDDNAISGSIIDPSSEKKSSFDFNSESVAFNTYDIAGDVNTQLLLKEGKVQFDSDYFVMNEDEMVFDSLADFPADNEVRASGIRINREGIIDVAPANRGGYSSGDTADTSPGRINTPGYIRVDRMVSNVEYPKTDNAWGVGYGDHLDPSRDGVNKPYDAYQVNPAYTSVMHDIKLTTRGGARLSDILPDFINKGIYVLDNTYDEERSGKDWNNYVVDTSKTLLDEMVSGPEECESLDCIASPWLGFVPTPQCPPGYSKVVTISPIRWKMSEAYYVQGYSYGSYSEKKEFFKNNFYAPTNPLTAKFSISATISADGSEHSHDTEGATPLTFQTNTWLNTTVSAVYQNDSGNVEWEEGPEAQQKPSFVGWHAVMGFLYYAGNYEDYLEGIGQGGYADGTIIWNLFPVMAEEMAAIANVYCYFERRTLDSWGWNNDFVDGGLNGYNQIGNFRFGFEKNNDNYNARLNDPALGYDEVW